MKVVLGIILITLFAVWCLIPVALVKYRKYSLCFQNKKNYIFLWFLTIASGSAMAYTIYAAFTS